MELILVMAFFTYVLHILVEMGKGTTTPKLSKRKRREKGIFIGEEDLDSLETDFRKLERDEFLKDLVNNYICRYSGLPVPQSVYEEQKKYWTESGKVNR